MSHHLLSCTVSGTCSGHLRRFLVVLTALTESSPKGAVREWGISHAFVANIGRLILVLPSEIVILGGFNLYLYYFRTQ